MAIIFPEGIYSEGQGIFNAMPYVRMIEAKKKAKDEAFTKYYDKLMSKINPEGVRDIDRMDPATGKGIEYDIQQMQKFGMDNKGEIAKGGAKKLEFEGKVRDIVQRIGQSKQVGAFQKEIGKSIFEGKIDPDDDDIEIQDRLGLSIYNPKFYKESYVNESQGLPEYNEARGTMWSWADLSPSIQTLKPKEITALYDFAIGDKQPQYNPNIPLQTVGNQKIATYTYSDSDIKDAADRLMIQIKEKPIDQYGKSLKKTYYKYLNDPNWMAKANPLFEKYYGKQIETAAEAAAADFILEKSKYQKQQAQSIPRPAGGRRGGTRGSQTIDPNLYYLSDEIFKESGFEIEVKQPSGVNNKYDFVEVSSIDPDELAIITGQDVTKGIVGIEPITLYDEKSKRNVTGFVVGYQDRDYYGKNWQKSRRERIKDRYINKYGSSKIKQQAGTKGAVANPSNSGNQPSGGRLY